MPCIYPLLQYLARTITPLQSNIDYWNISTLFLIISMLSPLFISHKLVFQEGVEIIVYNTAAQ